MLKVGNSGIARTMIVLVGAIVAIIVVVLIVVLVAGGGPDAQALFQENCVLCHGANRQGVTGLGLPLTPESLAAKSDEEIRDTITNGRPNTPMPAWGGTLSAEEIEALLQFIKYTPVQ